MMGGMAGAAAPGAWTIILPLPSANIISCSSFRFLSWTARSSSMSCVTFFLTFLINASRRVLSRSLSANAARSCMSLSSSSILALANAAAVSPSSLIRRRISSRYESLRASASLNRVCLASSARIRSSSIFFARSSASAFLIAASCSCFRCLSMACSRRCSAASSVPSAFSMNLRCLSSSSSFALWSASALRLASSCSCRFCRSMACRRRASASSSFVSVFSCILRCLSSSISFPRCSTWLILRMY
mmetsp:Transcript_22579/g.55699  ORF Transcript_22579/g.55699 Transcript_22579/m.55699 type:complete len:246 (+) Transcript_22579:1079-1816(+)